MKAVSTKTCATPYPHENENFWKKHISDFSNTGLTKKAYCDQTGINYGRFFHWMKKLSPSLVKKHRKTACFDKISKKAMLPVRLKQEPEIVRSSLLCTLHLKNGCVLQIRDTQALRIILEKWS